MHGARPSSSHAPREQQCGSGPRRVTRHLLFAKGAHLDRVEPSGAVTGHLDGPAFPHEQQSVFAGVWLTAAAGKDELQNCQGAEAATLVRLSQLVHLISLVERRPRACSFENAEVELKRDERELLDRIAWRSGVSPAAPRVLLRFVLSTRLVSGRRMLIIPPGAASCSMTRFKAARSRRTPLPPRRRKAGASKTKRRRSEKRQRQMTVVPVPLGTSVISHSPQLNSPLRVTALCR